MKFINFFHNKRRLIFLFGVLFVAVSILTGFFLIRNYLKFKADTATLTNFQSLANLTTDQEEPSQTIVNVPSEYSDMEISQALSGDTGARSLEIIRSIRTQANALAKQPIPAIQAQSQTIGTGSQNDFVDDLIIDIRNSQGQRVPRDEVQASMISATVTTVADNFVFDALVPESLRQIFLEVYPKIESIYGARSDSRTFKIFYDSTLTRGYYNPGLNEIWTGPYFLDNKRPVIHELTHGFHGLSVLFSYWEEGMASTISYYILEDSYGEESSDYGNSFEYDFTNNPLDSFDKEWSAFAPYQIGQVVFDKILLEDLTFFKKFNQLLYQQNIYKITYAQLIFLASQAIPSIEHQSTAEWFSQQYAFIPLNKSYYNDFYFPFAKNVEGYGGTSAVEWSFNGFIPASVTSLNIKGYDSNNQLELECNPSSINPGAYQLIQFATCQVPFTPTSFHGMLKFIITSNGDSTKSFTEYGVLHSSGQEIPISGLVESSQNPQSVKLTNLMTDWQITTPIQNKYFQITDANSRVAGRFKLDVLGSTGNIVKTRYFNKPTTVYDGYELQILDLPNDCSITSWQAQGTAGEIKLNTTLNKVCVDTVFLDKIPVERAITSNYQSAWWGLLGPKAYNLAMSFSNGYGNSGLKQVTVTTLAPFIIVKQESIGIPSQNTFRRRLTFNYNLNLAQINDGDAFFCPIIYIGMTAQCYNASVVKVNGLIYDFVPTDRGMLDGQSYGLQFLNDNLRSVEGYRLKYDVESLIFTTPAPSTTNLIKNGNFELGDTLWYKRLAYPTGVTGTGSITITKDVNCLNGSQCVKMVKGNSTASYVSQKIGAIEPNKIYRLFVRFKTDTASSANINFYDATAKKYYSKTVKGTGALQQTYIDVAATAITGPHDWYVYLYGTNASTIHYDEVLLKKMN